MVGEKRRGNGVMGGGGGMEIIMSHCHFNSRKGGNRGLIYRIYDPKRQSVSLCLGRESDTDSVQSQSSHMQESSTHHLTTQ